MKSKEFIVLNFTFLFLAQLQNYFRKVKYFIFDKKKGYLLYVLQFIFFQSFIIFAYLLYCFNSHTIVFFLLWRKPLCKHNRYSERILSWYEKSMITFKKHSCSLFKLCSASLSLLAKPRLFLLLQGCNIKYSRFRFQALCLIGTGRLSFLNNSCQGTIKEAFPFQSPQPHNKNFSNCHSYWSRLRGTTRLRKVILKGKYSEDSFLVLGYIKKKKLQKYQKSNK